jgi:hypothetical protein
MQSSFPICPLRFFKDGDKHMLEYASSCATLTAELSSELQADLQWFAARFSSVHTRVQEQPQRLRLADHLLSEMRKIITPVSAHSLPGTLHEAVGVTTLLSPSTRLSLSVDNEPDSLDGTRSMLLDFYIPSGKTRLQFHLTVLVLGAICGAEWRAPGVFPPSEPRT